MTELPMGAPPLDLIIRADLTWLLSIKGASKPDGERMLMESVKKGLGETLTTQSEATRRYPSNSLSSLGMGNVTRSRPKRSTLPWRIVSLHINKCPSDA